MDREYLTYQRPPIACHSMRLGEGIIFMNHAFEHQSGQYKTRSRARRAIADGLLVQLRPLLHAEVLVHSRKHIALFKSLGRRVTRRTRGNSDDSYITGDLGCW
jgi:hypothetical protein